MTILPLLPTFIVSVDLGQQTDYTAVVVLERSPKALPGPATYDLIYLQRWRGEPYTVLPERLRTVIERTQIRWSTLGAARGQALPLKNAPIDLLIDRTGVGAAPFDYLVAEGLRPVGIVIHSGAAVARADAATWHTPKRDLVSSVQVLLQTQRLKWDPALPGTEILEAELSNFRAKISASGHDTYVAGTTGGDDWRQNDHDDTILSLAMATWFGEYETSRDTTVRIGSYLGPRDDDDDRRRFR